ncbi:MAG: DUF1801 domain-containing protein [Planctomycetota bacterium]
MRPEIAAYIESAPPEQRPHLQSLHDKIVRELPDVEPILPNGFPVWTVNGAWCCGFATRRKGPMIYVMAPGVLDRHAELGSLRSGKSCVEFKASKSMTLEELDALAGVLYREAREAMDS